MSAHEATIAAMAEAIHAHFVGEHPDGDKRGSRTAAHAAYEAVRPRIEALEAENTDLLRQVREWLCEACNTVYPGPPQEGVKCVVCPSCGGFTAPSLAVERRRLQRTNADLLTEIRRVDQKYGPFKEFAAQRETGFSSEEEDAAQGR